MFIYAFFLSLREAKRRSNPVVSPTARSSQNNFIRIKEFDIVVMCTPASNSFCYFFAFALLYLYILYITKPLI